MLVGSRWSTIATVSIREGGGVRGEGGVEWSEISKGGDVVTTEVAPCWGVVRKSLLNPFSL